ncbi:hypothetical protein A2382_02575 [Candidatus Woesebacteria bacterium RIFOXYB1_FULL_38_16]|uniref:Uncharacterized protein n=1 Tax=Candidatus Woesebacteria bacterium RIFOXYB1_FULL_38_16 TaxID=1802538 RepID=A0A1F8CR97_9BACT|nr:MAG: hypothetical protein A2191_01960 [Candidatus Woesebacteria bacterium RIFOXYA1_FULL_38_9]OGM78834.1 MAG: hypothetical protein A2382_02575 [Candidatus Woesebacteria bacterium RIFOXYB1_FULL_38_16]
MTLADLIRQQLDKVASERANSAPAQPVLVHAESHRAKTVTITIVQLRPVMTTDAIKSAIDKIKAGNRVVIQFKERDILDIGYLLLMHNDGFLTIKNVENLEKRQRFGIWGEQENRVAEITINKWNNEYKSWFSGRLLRRLESVVIL